MHMENINPPLAVSQPLTLLLSCPSAIEQKLGSVTIRRSYEEGEVLFEQNTPCDGLYLIVAGEFSRITDRWDKRLSLAPLKAGDLAELAAILGDGKHISTVTAITAASALVFPRSALEEAFTAYPPLRMHLLEELGREVSRAYTTLSFGRGIRTRRMRKPAAS